MEESFDKDVRPLLDLIEKLCDTGISREISLPQIAVMGDQSSGKSSVLQSISGIPFPRGAGLVTRCPLELIMKKSPQDSSWSANISIRWSKDQPKESGNAYSMDELADKIRDLQNIIAADGENGFSGDSIVVKISSPDSPDLTLIDLPGIVRTATNGQSGSVIGQVNGLIHQYIEQPNTIILAVVPCNQDIATIDILERASSADPDGHRTIGVLTKPDLIGPGAEDEVVDVLLNIRKPLRLGYIMVKNSNQKQLNEKITMQDARKDEEKYFQNHPVFSQYLDRNIFGTMQLTSSLSRLLASHIRSTLPSIARDLKQLHTTLKAELDGLGESLLEPNGRELSEEEQESALQAHMVKKINLFLTILRNSCRGDYREKATHMPTFKVAKESNILSHLAEARLHAQLLDHYRVMQDAITAQRPLYKDDTESHYAILAKEMESSRGRELPGFLSTQVFTTCMVNLVEDWRLPVEDCNSRVFFSMTEVCQILGNHLLGGYPGLKDQIVSMAVDIAEQVHDKMRDKVTALIAKEQEPFTSQDVLLEVVNSIRFRAFDTILRQVLDTTDVKALGSNKYVVEEDIKRRLGECAVAIL